MSAAQEHIARMCEATPKTTGQIVLDARNDIDRGVPASQAYQGAFDAEASRLPVPARDPSKPYAPFAMPPVIEAASEARQTRQVKRGMFGQAVQ